MKLGILGSIVAFSAVAVLAGCDARDKVAREQADLQKTQQKEMQDVRDAQVKAVKDINEEKEEAAKHISEEARDVREAQAKAGTTSGVTSSSDTVTVTPEECAKLAESKTVSTELKAKYDACSKLKKK